MWGGAGSRAEYERSRRIIGGHGLKSSLESESINEAMLKNGITRLKQNNEIVLLHDFSDLRKPYSTEAESLGKVRDLNQNIINGYSSFNTVAVNMADKQLTLLNSHIYSNKAEEYVTEEEIKLQTIGCSPPADWVPADKIRYETVTNLIKTDSYINKKKIIAEQLAIVSQKIKTATSINNITHILDREFDSSAIFNFIATNLHDNFVIRMKTTRVSNEVESKLADSCEVFALAEKDAYKIIDGSIIINNGVCYTQKSKENGKIFWCTDDISEFLQHKNYKKNKRLTKSFSNNCKLTELDSSIDITPTILHTWYLNDASKQVPIKLVNQKFPNQIVRCHDKLSIKNKVYQDAKVIIDWGQDVQDTTDTKLTDDNPLNKYNIVRIQILNRDSKSIFKQSMLLVTNKAVTNDAQAIEIYHLYLKRAKIEGVFKFLKEVLGWEDSQIQDFEPMKTLLTFCFFVAAYFYEIESVLINDPIIKYLAYLGNGKGKVTRTYVFRGLSKLVIKKVTDDWIQEHGITQEMLEEMYKFAAMGTVI